MERRERSEAGISTLRVSSRQQEIPAFNPTSRREVAGDPFPRAAIANTHEDERMFLVRQFVGHHHAAVVAVAVCFFRIHIDEALEAETTRASTNRRKSISSCVRRLFNQATCAA